MEFCVGGSVSDFAKTWCKEDKDGVLDPQSDRFDYFDIMSLNPLKVSALCVGMIECLDDVFLVKKGIVHRDIKPENFLVRVDPKDGECTIILGDLGLTEILDSRSSSTSKILVSSKKVKKTEHERSICGTLIYNSYETLKYCVQDQRSDGYSLGLSILAMFFGENPLSRNPYLRGKDPNSFEFLSSLIDLLSHDIVPPINISPLFESLLSVEDGKYESVYYCLDEVFKGLTQIDRKDRMGVHDARLRVQGIKSLLPTIGSGWKYPSIEDIISKHKVTRRKSPYIRKTHVDDGVQDFSNSQSTSYLSK
ncbi:hypothetical protein ADUPG1_011571 [Aduncisulcus paluster]|uniref:Protein kinase domain-containing protein n=1 Tax=Aduncisulcus paluster TaxID=2918883 RepID=A0ABQ5K144_9EUKA|nr:hypothetical protein ADUPG1_011571 [Aduncisulcus paluster]